MTTVLEKKITRFLKRELNRRNSAHYYYINDLNYLIGAKKGVI